MKVRAIKSFSGPHGSYRKGQAFDLPEGVDWLRAGFVVEVGESKAIPKITRKAETSDVKRKRKG